MAILNFPSDPSTQNPVNTYSPDSTPLASENGVTYLWDGEKWTASTSGAGDIYVNVDGDTMTGDLIIDGADLSAAAGTFSGRVDVGAEDPTFGYQTELNPSGTSWIGSYSANCLAVNPDSGKTKCTVNYVGIPTDGDPNDWSFRVAQFDGAFDLVAPRFLVGADGSTYLGGTLPQSPNITLNANGSASFGGGAQQAVLTIQGIQSDSASNNTVFEVYRRQTNGNFYPSIIRMFENGNATFSGTVTDNPSDIKFKTNITDAPKQLSDVKALKLRAWDWKPDAIGTQSRKDRHRVGLVAQEAEQVDAKLVYDAEQGEDDSFKAIDYKVLTMKLLGALQESITRIEALEAEVQQLKGG